MFTPIMSIMFIITTSVIIKSANKGNEVLAAYAILGYAGVAALMIGLSIFGIIRL